MNFSALWKHIEPFQEPPSLEVTNIKSEVPDPDEGLGSVEDALGSSSSLNLDDEGLRKALILSSEDLGPVGGKLQLQMEDQSEGQCRHIGLSCILLFYYLFIMHSRLYCI